MRIFIAIITVSVLLSFSIANAQIEKRESKISLKFNDEINISSLSPDYFISGYIFNPKCSFDGKQIDNINVTDTVCFYKIQGDEQLYRTTTSLWFFDLSKEIPFSIKPPSTNLKNTPDDIDDSLKSKILDHYSHFYSFWKVQPLRIIRFGIDYNDKNLNKNGSTDLSYIMQFYVPRSKYSCCFYDSILIELLFKPKQVTEILYVETYNKYFTVNNVEFFNAYEINNKTNDYDDLSWDFVKSGNYNYLILKFKMESSPIGDFIKHGFKIKISGNYNK